MSLILIDIAFKHRSWESSQLFSHIVITVVLICKQIADLRNKLEDAEQRALENLELASSKDTHYEKKVRACTCLFR